MRTRLSRLLSVATLTSLLFGAGAPALVAAAPERERPMDSGPVLLGADPEQGRTPAASSKTDEPELVVGDSGGRRIVLDRDVRPVAPGLDLTSFQWLDAGGFVRGDALVADLGERRLSGDYLFSGQVTKPEALSKQAERRNAVAAVNGDFFDINNSSAPLGTGVAREGVIKGPVPGWNNAVGVDTAGIGRMTKMFLEGTVTLPGGRTARLEGLNQHQLPANSIGGFTPMWGSYSRSSAAAGAGRVREVTVTAGKVAATGTVAGSGAIGAGSFVLLGRDTGADALAGLTVGDAVALSYAPRSDDGEMAYAVGGNTVLLRDGTVQPQGDKATHPRTSVGFSADGKKMFLVTVDGRQRDSRGMTYQELGSFMKELGADDALNLDGGGSSTMVAREAGETGVDVENEPSDGGERAVPNGLALFAQEGSGRLTTMRVVAAADEEDEGLRRVFPGLTRSLQALGYDETYAPVVNDPRWRSTPAAVGRVDARGVFTGSRPGDAEVVAQAAGASGSMSVSVLGMLARTRSSVDKVVLTSATAAGSFSIVGYDGDGFQAAIDTSDVTLDYDRELLDVRAGDDGAFTVTATSGAVGTVITATVQGVVTHIPVSVGLQSVIVGDFADAAAWKFGTARGSGSVAPAPGRDGGPALRMSYDFTKSTATRTAYATAPKPIPLPGQPLAVGAWVLGSGKGEWTAFTMIDAEGKAQSLYGPYITWTGWKYLEVPIPQTVAFPVTVSRFYTIETKASQSYTGSVVVDDITAKVAPRVDVPAVPRVQDPVVVQNGSLREDGRRWRFAVVSDAQFVAAAPDSPLVTAARRTLREALAAKPDLIVINGDWVDTGYPQDMALAARIINEEIGTKVPWYYNPGNHEIYGPGDTTSFRAQFGATHRTFDHKGTRFVLLDSSTGTLRGGGFDQWTMLRDAIDGAAKDDAINGVVTMWHHPPRDPSPLKNSQMGDREEAETVETWLADFRRDTGKGAAFIGSHVGSFSANSVDGVPYVVNGNSGKAPSTLPADGGFSGWSLVGIDADADRAPVVARHRAAPEARSQRPWLRVEVRAHVDDLTIGPINPLRAGTTVAVRATVHQGGRAVPVDYPVSAAWAGSSGVHVGSLQDAGSRVLASYDPRTGVLSALRPGTGSLSVTVNEVTRTTWVSVT